MYTATFIFLHNFLHHLSCICPCSGWTFRGSSVSKQNCRRGTLFFCFSLLFLLQIMFYLFLLNAPSSMFSIRRCFSQLWIKVLFMVFAILLVLMCELHRIASLASLDIDTSQEKGNKREKKICKEISQKSASLREYFPLRMSVCKGVYVYTKPCLTRERNKFASL